MRSRVHQHAVSGVRLAVLVALVAACHGGCGGQSAPPAAAGQSTVVVAPPPSVPVPVITGGVCEPPHAPSTPVEYGQCILSEAIARAHSTVPVNVVLATDPSANGVDVPAAPESYAIVSQPEHTLVVGRDAVGAMYGALEIAERLDAQGQQALPLPAPVKASPFMKMRAANLFLVLPEPGKPWWFRDPRFWVEYLDMMARARLNFLDLHGMYSLETTLFPNALLWFATSASLPNVGLPQAEREQNLAMLNTVLKMAETRGITVGLMNYMVNFSLTGEGKGKESEQEKAEMTPYNAEAVADLAKRAPGLAYLGFRIGETGHPASWYIQTYIDPVKAVHSKMIAYTRNWGTKKSELMPVLEASGPEMIVEAKYNGEHFGPAYVISGGGMEKQKTYSYEDFLEPPAPYRFVFQVRAGGTHRIFRYASYARTRRAVLAMGFSPRVYGFTLEAAHAYLPQEDFYHAKPEDSFSPWSFRRDELSYLLFGRLGYDPNTPEAVFRKALADRVGTDALWDAVQAASDITPNILAAGTCGPDQRDYAPELEVGGPVSYWAEPSRTKTKVTKCKTGRKPFDEFAVASPYDTAQDLLEHRGTSRVSSVDVADEILADAKTAATAAEVAIDPKNAEARDVVRECTALADLGNWFGHKERAATALAVYEGSGAEPWLAAARAEVQEDIGAFRKLTQDTTYISPFVEKMRMHYLKMDDFHWTRELAIAEEDVAAVEDVAQAQKGKVALVKGPLPNPRAWLSASRSPGPGLASLKITPEDPAAPTWQVNVTFGAPPPEGSHVHVLYRPFRSDTAGWTPVDAKGSGASWQASVPGTGHGAMFAVEIDGPPGHAWRYPDVNQGAPYIPLAP